MFSIDINEAIIVKERRALEAALSTNPKTAAALRKVIRRAIMEARRDVSGSIRSALSRDPRGSAQAVRTVVYKKVLGANINILNSRRSHGTNNYQPVRRLGGNRRPRSQRTEQIDSYAPLDRGFILRFVNSGTAQRDTRYGNRGSIRGRHFFRAAGEKALAHAAVQLSAMIDSELQSMMTSVK